MAEVDEKHYAKEVFEGAIEQDSTEKDLVNGVYKTKEVIDRMLGPGQF